MVGTLFSIYKHFGDFVKCVLRFCCKFSMKIIFYLPVKTDKPKFSALLIFFVRQLHLSHKCLECLETRRHLGSSRKTVNSQGYGITGALYVFTLVSNGIKCLTPALKDSKTSSIFFEMVLMCGRRQFELRDLCLTNGVLLTLTVKSLFIWDNLN